MFVCLSFRVGQLQRKCRVPVGALPVPDSPHGACPPRADTEGDPGQDAGSRGNIRVWEKYDGVPGGEVLRSRRGRGGEYDGVFDVCRLREVAALFSPSTPPGILMGCRCNRQGGVKLNLYSS